MRGLICVEILKYSVSTCVSLLKLYKKYEKMSTIGLSKMQIKDGSNLMRKPTKKWKKLKKA